MVKRSTFSEANARRPNELFAKIYHDTYKRHAPILADSKLSKVDIKRLYIMDSTTITLFKDKLKDVGLNPINGKKKGGIKAHTIIKSDDNMPCFIRYTSASKHDHLLLKEVNLPEGSILCFDKAYVDYAQYEVFSTNNILFLNQQKSEYKKRKYINIILHKIRGN